VEQTQKIVNVQKPVERVIGNFRQKYFILNSTRPIDVVSSNDQVTTLEKIVCYMCMFFAWEVFQLQTLKGGFAIIRGTTPLFWFLYKTEKYASATQISSFKAF